MVGGRGIQQTVATLLPIAAADGEADFQAYASHQPTRPADGRQEPTGAPLLGAKSRAGSSVDSRLCWAPRAVLDHQSTADSAGRQEPCWIIRQRGRAWIRGEGIPSVIGPDHTECYRRWRECIALGGEEAKKVLQSLVGEIPTLSRPRCAMSGGQKARASWLAEGAELRPGISRPG